MPDIKKLEPEIKNHGYTMRLVKRTDSVAMYSKAGGYEVIRIRKHPGGEMFGKKLDPYEMYPGDELFGMYGWYFAGANGRAQADAKYDELVAKEKAKSGGKETPPETPHQTVTDEEVSESIAQLVD